MKICQACSHAFTSVGWQCPACGHVPAVIDGFASFAPERCMTDAGFPTDAFSELFHLEERNFWYRSRNKLLVWALGKYFKDAGSILEIGCGTGFILSAFEKAFPELQISGSEIYSAGLGFALTRVKKAALYQMDARRLPFESEFDVICAFDVLEHIQEDETVLQEIRKALKPGGGIILTVPQHRFLWSAADDYAFHKRRYVRRDLVSKVEGKGFRVIRVTSFVALLLPFMALSRFAQRAPKDDYDPLNEFRLHPLLNVVLEKVLDVERSLIKFGLTLPMGGSLLLVARKN